MQDKKSSPTFSFTSTIKDIPVNDWDALFAKDTIEGWGFHKALEESRIKEFSLGYLLAKRNNELVAIIPFFTNVFSLTTLIQGKLQGLIFGIQKIFKNFLKIKLLFVGFPTAEELYLGVSDKENPDLILEQALKEFYTFMHKEKIGTILFLNLSQKLAKLATFLSSKGFVPMENFPNTRITIQSNSLPDYINCLSKNTRKDIKRKLKKSSQQAILHTEIVENVDNTKGRLFKLYLNNFTDSDIHFETLTPEFFQNICQYMPTIAKVFLTRDKDKIVAFNLCLVKGDTCIDKFIGFDSDVYRAYHLYYTTFCHNIDWCIKNGIRYYQMGITDYAPKLRLGAQLIPLFIYLRCANPILNLFTRLIARLIQPKNFDPTLKKLALRNT